MAKSIIQERTDPVSRECYLCREEAERNGYYGELRHTNKEVDEHLKRVAQQAFEEKYGHALWMQEFGVNYLDGREEYEIKE